MPLSVISLTAAWVLTVARQSYSGYGARKVFEDLGTLWWW